MSIPKGQPIKRIDVREKDCEPFINEIVLTLTQLKAGEFIEVMADKDRITCMHMLIKNTPRYLMSTEFKENYVIMKVRKVR